VFEQSLAEQDATAEKGARMSDTGWGLAENRPAESRPSGAGRAGLPPRAAQAAHSGIVWLHVSAIALWLLVIGILWAVSATGRDIPPVVFIAGLAAAAGHAVFVALHLAFAAMAKRRQSQAKQETTLVP
jgi:hypothetical protein